jgi:hypothetical protein
MKLKIFLQIAYAFIASMVVGLLFGGPLLGVVLFIGAIIVGRAYPAGSYAFSICGSIAAGHSPDCSYPLTAGNNERLILYNFNDVDTLDRAVGNSLIVEEIVMIATKVGYAFNGQNYSNEPKYRMRKGPYVNTYEHEAAFLVFGYNGAVKKELEAMAKGKLIAVIENNFRGATGDHAFELLGGGSGLFVESIERDPNDQDNNGAFKVVLKTGERGGEASLPFAVFDTSYAVTKAMIDATLVP